MYRFPAEANEFTEEQCVVFREVVLGKSEKEIAEALGRSQHTVHGHIKTFYRRFGVDSRPKLLQLLMSRQQATIERLRSRIAELDPTFEVDEAVNKTSR